MLFKCFPTGTVLSECITSTVSLLQTVINLVSCAATGRIGVERVDENDLYATMEISRVRKIV